MREHTHPILIKGNYRIAAVTQGHAYDPADITSYAVQTAAGAKLRQDMTLEDARLWVDQQIQYEIDQRLSPCVAGKTLGRRR